MSLYMTPIFRFWLVQLRLDLSFLHPIAVLWDSVQPGAQSHLTGASSRNIGAMYRL